MEKYIDSDTENEDAESSPFPSQVEQPKSGSFACPIDFTQSDEELPSAPPRKKGKKFRNQALQNRGTRSYASSREPSHHANLAPSLPQAWKPLNPGSLREHQSATNGPGVNGGYQGVSYLRYQGLTRVEDEEQSEEEEEEVLMLEDITQLHDHTRTTQLTSANSRTSFLLADHAHTTIRDQEGPPQDSQERDDWDFAQLMKRAEGKRGYELLAEKYPQSNLISSGNGSSQSQSLRIGDSQTSNTSSTSLQELEGLTDEEQVRRNKAIAFLESFPISYLTQLHNSQLLLLAQQQYRGRKSPKKPRDTETIEEDEEDSQGPLIPDDDDLEAREEDSIPSSQETVRSEPGVTILLKNRKTGNNQVISFPDDPLARTRGVSAQHKQDRIFAVLAVLYEAVLTTTVVTLRDIFYRDKVLFHKQSVVDKIVDDLVATAAMKRRDFCVCASAKGLIAARSMSIIRRSGEVVKLSTSAPTLIDPIERIQRLESTEQIEWILVVEKDAVFQTLCSARLLEDDRIGAGVLITGKGFPDLATKQMLHLLSITFPRAKIFALVDADPHGISILSTYTFGSKNSKHSPDHADLALGDKIQWTGLRPTEIKNLGIAYDDLLPLEEADVRLAMKMLDDPVLPNEWKREICEILHTNRKAEIEIILDSKVKLNVKRKPPITDEPDIGIGAENSYDVDLSEDILDTPGQSQLQMQVQGDSQSQGQSQGGRGKKRTSQSQIRLVEYVVKRILQ
ncbi:uncharacterized protein I303_104206 [Kwoniella dejecticola CBS 10117]|uniref:DNA topoisomerase (ATP-hydrolyzing) n=1 Tax=Kwoniella dejecticola CBS 10117 TaxID=1296121 RepID=A0A1A6A5Z4_9TREE|nr:uncharacterized protein I303_04818 [Kwoniella dejecticola CBS 10117]OBR85482.1 hypothetical protein I303_04818 [Kwoniella dejecticola CBS 10117]